MLFYLIFIVNLVCFSDLNAVPLQKHEAKILNSTRRILGGRDVGDTRPYMVYLRAARPATGVKTTNDDWLCGGTIIHDHYILTSAACIEDVQQFYVISGTHRWVPPTVTNDECILNGAKKAVWKCVPKSYVFDGKEFNNVLWMANDIAVVKVEDDFNFKRRVRGCDFVPQKIAFNNISDEFEKAGTIGSIAGWGSSDRFSSVSYLNYNTYLKQSINSPILQETEVVLLSKRHCKKRWDPRYHHIIDESMICAKDGSDGNVMSEACSDQVNCKELAYSDEDEDPSRRFLEPTNLVVHDPRHESTRRATEIGGFCENDHGGPLVVGQGKSAKVVGVISACMTREISKKCYGPYLYTSVWKNRHLINCAIDKEIGLTCKKLLRSSKTHMIETIFNWNQNSNRTKNMPERNKQHKKMRRIKNNGTITMVN
ncbi:uncharacterized protein LOC106130645 [Amyelois transitella]|uniref:uncharacterized protein LOC106130645 n=1 Tax=Amyelois transitella TaxID=680683 RepID=UPI00298F4023|nr:uncharacterized protein LOC106130645 [Amyelois transitella]